MSHSVRRHLRLEITDYDATIRRWIPGYETMLSVASESVASVRPRRVVDLGSGTGALAEALLERPEVGVVELLDVDPEMLYQARARVERFGERAVFTLRSFDEPFGPCDAFAASLSLHHIRFMEAKAELFARAFAALRPGGVFVNADATMPADEAGRAKLFRYWADHQMEQGIPEEQAYAHFEEWSGEDTYMPLEVELTALRDAGFEAEQVWAAGPIGVVVATKPAV
jgi:tRNA (cmo5U34)-methyltransferase